MLSTTLIGAGFPANSGKRRKSGRFENYNGDGGGDALCTNRYTSVNDLEISPGSVREVPEICGICRRIFLLLAGTRKRVQYIYDSRSCVRD